MMSNNTVESLTPTPSPKCPIIWSRTYPLLCVTATGKRLARNTSQTHDCLRTNEVRGEESMNAF